MAENNELKTIEVVRGGSVGIESISMMERQSAHAEKKAGTNLQAGLQKVVPAFFSIWRTPYSEMEPQGGGIELA